MIYTEHEADGRFKMRLFCVDPSYNLQECLDKGRSTIFFSATLLPVQYYKEMLSTREDNYAIYAQSSFEEEQKLLLIGKDVSSRYKRRNESEFQRMAAYIADITAAKAGNYMVFFPSYKMLDEVYEQFLKIAPVEMQLLKQESGMTEVEREEFYRHLQMDQRMHWSHFVFLGGIFGEGIDLKQEQLIGAVIIGTGLPADR